jgi:drug/metabolite transporter (DMT)-like permease
MEAGLFAAALTSAVLHAAWNAAVKAQPNPREAMAAQMIAAALLALPGLAWTGWPPVVAWPWIALSTLLNMGAVLALLRAYERGGFGTVYPAARATAVLAVVAAAPLAMGERLGPLATAGVLLVAAALALLGADTRRAGAGHLPRAALGWTLLAGLLIGGYVLADAQGVRRSGSPLAYGLAVSIANAIAIGWLQRGAGSPLWLVRRHAAVALPAALASMASYLLILWVFLHAPVALAAALRDTSAVFAMLIAVLWLKEPLPPRRVAVLLLAVAGAMLLRAG